MNTENILQVCNVGKSFGVFNALEGVNFNLSKGEVLALVGSNGAGKSTLLKILSGLLKQTTGEIRIDNQILNIMNPNHRTMLGVVPQDYAFYHELTALENLRFYLKMHNSSAIINQDRLIQILSALNFPLNLIHKKSGFYSGGNKRKLNLALGVIHNPAVLLLDEPTVGIDSQSKTDIYAFLKSLTQNHTSVVIATHHMQEVENIADTVGFLSNGKMMVIEKVSNLLDKQNFSLRIKLEKLNVPTKEMILKKYPHAKVMGRILQLDGVAGAKNLTDSLLFLGSCGVDLHSVQIMETGLEQMYVDLMAQKITDQVNLK
jgi:ABC-2 type transport system ATP-binding protein